MKMKKNYLLSLFFLPLICFAQTPKDGDYRTVASGNWSDITKWQVRTASSWGAAATAPTATTTIYIQTGHTITVDVASASCDSFHIHATGGVLAIGTNTLNVNGKIRAYIGTAVTTTGADGVFYSSQATGTNVGAAIITTTSTGSFKLVGNTRNISTGTDWNTNGLNSPGCTVEFALNAGNTGTVTTGMKASAFIFSSGTVSMTGRFAPDGGSAGTGSLTIKSGATLISSNSGVTSQVISRTGSTRSGTVTIEANGTLELTGASPRIDANAFVNNGNIVYTRTSSTSPQSLLDTSNAATGAVRFSSYKNLTYRGTNTKTIPAGLTINISDTLTNSGTSSTNILAYGAGSNLTYSAGTGTFVFNNSSSVALTSTAPEWPSSNGPTNILVLSNTFSFGDLTTAITRTLPSGGSITLNGGTLTLNSPSAPASTFTNTLNLSNNTTLTKLTANNFNGGTGPGVYVFGTVATDVINVKIGSATAPPPSSINSSSELPASAVGVLNLTIFPGFSYAFNSSTASTKVISNLILNGTFTDDLAQARILSIKENITGSGTCNVGKTLMSGNTISSNISGATFANLELNDADGFALTGIPNVTGTLSLTNGVLNNSTNNMTLSDNVQINRAAGSFSAAPVFGTTVNVNYNDVALTTTGFELPTSTTVLKNLTINNAGGVTLNAPATVNGVFTLTNGVLTTSTANKLVLADVATTAGGSNTCYVSGPMVMNTNAAATYTFPVGKAGVYRPFSVNTATANANAYTGEYFNTDPHAISSTYITPVTGIADNEYYDIAHSTGSDAATITFTLNGAVTGGTASDRIIIAHYNSGTPGWENTAGGYLQGDATSGSITSGSLTSFSPFTFGLKPAIPLPLHFISFEALNNNGFVKLKWKTADEINVNRYVVEESINGNLFIEIKNINANNRSGTNLYSFTRPTEINNNTYFRIKIVNANGKIEYSNIILVKLATKEVTIYPNPVSNTLNISGVKNTTSYRIMNAMGQVVLMQNTTSSSFSIDVANLQSGLYFIEIVSTDKTSVKQTFIKK